MPQPWLPKTALWCVNTRASLLNFPLLCIFTHTPSLPPPLFEFLHFSKTMVDDNSQEESFEEKQKNKNVATDFSNSVTTHQNSSYVIFLGDDSDGEDSVVVSPVIG